MAGPEGIDSDLQLDPLNPPRYCPHCARNGLKTRVKKFKLARDKDDLTVMCKNGLCPWPFSVMDPEDATVKASLVGGDSKGKPGLDGPGGSVDDLVIVSVETDFEALYHAAQGELRKLEVHLGVGYEEVRRRDRELQLCKEELQRLRRKLRRTQSALARNQPLWPRCQACLLRRCLVCPQDIWMYEPYDELLPDPDHNVQLGLLGNLGPVADLMFEDV